MSPYLSAQINSSSYPDAPHIPRNYGATPRSDRASEATDDPILSQFAAAAAASKSMNQNPESTLERSLHDEKPIPLPSRVLHKFYEPVILLVSLMDAVGPNSSPSSTVSDLPPTDQETDLQVFKAFVNKLSHVCSSAKGRETVTSFVVLRDKPAPKAPNGRIHYWFAMNEQSSERLAETKTYVENLLRKIGRAPSMHDNLEGWEGTKREIFRDVLVFNRRRITTYLNMLQERVAKCLDRLRMENTNESER